MLDRELKSDMEGASVRLEGTDLSLVWHPFCGEYQCRAAGGLWVRNASGWSKLAELAEGLAVITDSKGRTYSVSARAAASKGNRLEVCGETEVDGVAVQVVSRWELTNGGRTLRWHYTYEPSQAVKDWLFSVHFNLLPSQWGTLTFPSYCGFHDGICYAIYPERENPWWMRLEGAKCVKNVHYPFTYRPTTRMPWKGSVVLSGHFLAAPWSIEQLNRHLRAYFVSLPQPARIDFEKTQAVCLQGLLRAEAAAREQGFLAEDEVVFLDIVRPERWLNQGHGPGWYGAGFSCGFAGHAVSPLTEHARRNENSEAQRLAKGIANWIVRHAQTPYGAYYDIVNTRGGGCDFICEDFVYPHTTARIAVDLFAAHEFFSMPEYLDSALRASCWLQSIQEPDGALPWKRIASTGETDGTAAYAASAAMALVSWSLAYRATEEGDFLDSAKRLASWIRREFVTKLHYGGWITDDHPGNGLNRWEVPALAPATYVVEGSLQLREATGDGRYLKMAEEAGHYLLSWQWIWEPEPPLGVRVMGSAQQAGVWDYTISQTLGEAAVYMAESYLHLFEATGDPLWKAAAELALFRVDDDMFFDQSDPLFGSMREGWNINLDRDATAAFTGQENGHGLFLGVSHLIGLIDRYRALLSGVRPAEKSTA